MANGSIVITVSKSAPTGPYPLSKSYTIADGDIDNVVTAFQSLANVSVNGTATTAQVWLYIAGLLRTSIINQVQAANVTPAVVPPPITVT